jgi:ribosome-associated toxin RatA of RatAB toxin-antitoxin module
MSKANVHPLVKIPEKYFFALVSVITSRESDMPFCRGLMLNRREPKQLKFSKKHILQKHFINNTL